MLLIYENIEQDFTYYSYTNFICYSVMVYDSPITYFEY